MGAWAGRVVHPAAGNWRGLPKRSQAGFDQALAGAGTESARTGSPDDFGGIACFDQFKLIRYLIQMFPQIIRPIGWHNYASPTGVNCYALSKSKQPRLPKNHIWPSSPCHTSSL